MLGAAAADPNDGDESASAVLIVSPEQKRAAREFRANRIAAAAATTAAVAAANPDDPTAVAMAKAAGEATVGQGSKPRVGTGPEVPPVPIFHCGPLQWQAVAGEGAEGGPSSVWPLFLRSEDLDTMWREVGKGAPQPPTEVTDLARLLSPQGGLPAEAASAKLLLCAPLDAITYMRAHNAALEAADGTAANPEVLVGGGSSSEADALRQVLGRGAGPMAPDNIDDRPVNFDRT